MIGECRFCNKRNGCSSYLSYNGNVFGCIHFQPEETLLESEITEWLQFVNYQKRQTAETIIRNKRKFIRKDDNCIEVEKENGDRFIIPIDDDYLDYATDMLDEFISDADYNDLAIGDKITFTFIHMSGKEYEELDKDE